MADEQIQESSEQLEPHGDEQRHEIDWKAEARKWEKRAKDNKEAAERLTALETDSASKISELEKRAEKAEQEANDLRTQKEYDQMVTELANEHAIPETAIRALKGSSKEELAASISAIKELVQIPSAPVIRDSGRPGNPNPPTDKSKFVKTLFNNE